jgi:hypothetical protein
VAHQSYELEGLLFGIRTDSTVFARWLAETLPAKLVTDEEANPNYSVVIGSSSGKVGKRFHVLYRDSTVLIRTFDAAELVRTLLADLDSLTFWRRDDAVYVQAALLSTGGIHALFPAELAGDFEGIKRRMVAKKLELPGLRCVAVDLQTGEALAPPHSLEVDDALIAELADEIGSEPTPWPRVAVDGATKIDLVCTMGLPRRGPYQPVSRAFALYVLASMAPNLAEVGQAGLEALRRLVERAVCWEIAPDQPRVLAESVLDLFRIVGPKSTSAPA